MAIRFNTGSLFRNASVPPHTGFTACGWAEMAVDTNAQQCLFSLEEPDGGGGNYIIFATDTDGTTLQIFSTPSSPVTLQALTVGTKFFWAITSVGTGAGNTVGYYRAAGSNTFTTVTLNRTGGGAWAGQMWLASDKFTQPWNGKLWNCKIFDRSLTAAELLIESFYEEVMFPSSLNVYSKLGTSSDTGDYSGNARSWTAAGTLTTEDGGGLWKPQPIRVLTAAAPSAQINAVGGFSLASISAPGGFSKASVSAVGGFTI